MATIGKAKCGTCKEEIPVKQNANGTVNLSCPWCGVSKYVKKGEQAHAIEMRGVTLGAAPVEEKPAAAAPEKKEDKAPPAAPAKKPASSMPWARAK